jgi:hypothetical protein
LVFAAAVPVVCMVAGCQEQRTIVVEQTQAASMAAAGAPVGAPPAQHKVASPCTPPWGSGPFTPMGKPIHTENVPKPPRALAEHVSGCGGVRFRIGPDGAPEDVEVLADYPVGYGFGDAVRQVVVTSRWAPRDDLSWHYLNFTILVPHGSGGA